MTLAHGWRARRLRYATKAFLGEIKRLFVRPASQGFGLARKMVQKLSYSAYLQGYKRVRLETGALQTEARALYDAMGFKRIAAYYACPEWLQRGARFFEASTCTIGQTQIAA